jgi:hypothetical protein
MGSAGPAPHEGDGQVGRPDRLQVCLRGDSRRGYVTPKEGGR